MHTQLVLMASLEPTADVQQTHEFQHFAIRELSVEGEGREVHLVLDGGVSPPTASGRGGALLLGLVVL